MTYIIHPQSENLCKRFIVCSITLVVRTSELWVTITYFHLEIFFDKDSILWPHISKVLCCICFGSGFL